MSKVFFWVGISLAIVGLFIAVHVFVDAFDKANDAKTDAVILRIDLKKAEAEVKRLKKAAADCGAKVSDLEKKLEKAKGDEGRWMEQSLRCLGEYSRATGQKDNSDILRAVMSAVEIKNNQR